MRLRGSQRVDVTTLDRKLTTTSAAPSRAFRIFVASTFRDMDPDRDVLAQDVFHGLRNDCAERGVTCSIVDLRWGITEDQRARGRILPICLEQIDRCRPHFIGMLGERYGWDVTDIAPETMRRYPWLEDHRESSITEIEICHGALDNAVDPAKVRIYFRTRSYLDTLPTGEHEGYFETPGRDESRKYGAQAAEQRARRRARKLADLKDRIANSSVPRRDYDDLPQLAELVSADLRTLLDESFPKTATPDPNQLETDRHLAMAWSLAEAEAAAGTRHGTFVGRSAISERFDAHVAGSGNPLVVSGDPGIGKSALLANWLLRYREAHPEDHVIVHLCGASPASSTAYGLAGRLLAEIGALRGISYPAATLAQRAQGLRFVLPVVAQDEAERIVLIVDGLDKLADRGDDLNLDWLPREYPPQVRVIVTSAGGKSLEALRRRQWPTVTLEALEPGERLTLIDRYLREFGQVLEADLAEQIVQTGASGNPLYLRTLLDEMRLIATPDELRTDLPRLLEAETVPELFEIILTRLENRYEERCPGLLRNAMGLLSSARYGLSESELADLLGDEDRPAKAIHWATLHAALGRALYDRDGVLAFAHPYLLESASARFVRSDEDRHSMHERLADYFHAHGFGPRRAEELPWQLARSGNWTRLAEVLAEPAVLSDVGIRDDYELRNYWTQIEEETRFSFSDCARELLAGRSLLSTEALLAMETVLWNQGHYGPCLEALDEVIRRTEPAGETVALAWLWKQAADANLWLGHKQRSLKLIERARAVMADNKDLNGLAACLRVRAMHFMQGHKYEKALECIEESMMLSKRTGNSKGRRADLTNKAACLTMLGRLEEAQQVHAEEEPLARQLMDWDGLTRSLNNQGNLNLRSMRLDAALELYRQAEALAIEYGNTRSRLVSVTGQAQASAAASRKEDALTLVSLAADIAATLHDPDAIARVALLQQKIADDFGADQGLDQLARLEVPKLSSVEDKVDELRRQGHMLCRQRALDEARDVLEEARQLARDNGLVEVEIRSTSELAGVCKLQGDTDLAYRMIQEARKLAESCEDKELLQITVSNEAVALMELAQSSGDHDQAVRALELAQRAREIASRLSLTDRHAFSCGTCGTLERMLGRMGEAGVSFDKALQCARETEDEGQLTRALLNSAAFHLENGELPQARALLDEARPLVDRKMQPDLRRQFETLQTALAQVDPASDKYAELDRLNDTADEHLDAGRFRESENVFGEMLGLLEKDEPIRLVVQFRRALARLQLKDYRSALKDFDGLLDEEISNGELLAEIRVQRALANRELGDHDAEIRDLDLLLECPDTPAEAAGRALLWRAQWHTDNGNLEAGIADLARLVETGEAPHVQRMEARYRRAMALMLNGAGEEASADLDRVLADEATELNDDIIFHALHSRAVLLRDDDRIAEALADLERALGLDADPDRRAMALIEQAQLFRDIDRPDEAMKALSSAVDLEATSESLLAQALFYRGTLLAELDENEVAIADLDRATELAALPDELSGEAILSRGFINADLDNFYAAIDDITAFLALPGAQPERQAHAHYERAGVYSRIERREDAIADYSFALKLQTLPIGSRDLCLFLRGIEFDRWGKERQALDDWLVLAKSGESERVLRLLGHSVAGATGGPDDPELRGKCAKLCRLLLECPAVDEGDRAGLQSCAAS